MYQEEFVHRAHQVVDERVTAGGGHIDGFYYCPHHPRPRSRDTGATATAGSRAGHAAQAAGDLDLDLSRSFTVGDKWTDVQAGAAAGRRGHPGADGIRTLQRGLVEAAGRAGRHRSTT